VQVPWLPLTPQLWQEGHEVTPQQNPSVQWLLAHWVSPAQALPFPSFDRQVPPGVAVQ
jgi:hypothetical protein